MHVLINSQTSLAIIKLNAYRRLGCFLTVQEVRVLGAKNFYFLVKASSRGLLSVVYAQTDMLSK